jgi:glycosyltransferase involved in cell wall biosynthesis
LKPEITAVILTYNESANIKPCIESLDWADRQLVFDSFSQDDTAQIAEECGAAVIQSAFLNYAQQRNGALAEIETDWVFFVDADERGTTESAKEISAVMQEGTEAGWYIPRHNYIFGKLTIGGGWFPDYQLRLFKNGHVHYEKPVHEIAVVDGQIGHLTQPLIHFNYQDPAHFHAKQKVYVDFDVEELNRQDIRPNFYTPYTQVIRQFWWRMFTLGGYVDGFHGLRLSSYLAYYEYVKYRRLRQLQQ